jgi:hypothetical protein
MLMAETAQYRRYRAPQEDGQALVDPPRGALVTAVDRNRQHIATLDYDFQGRSLRDLAAGARKSLLHQAFAYTREYRDLGDSTTAAKDAGAPFILSGHQPQLYHPGVWYKNFVLGQLADEVSGVAIHLLIDSDSCRTATIRVPTGTIAEPRVETVEFDTPAAEMPYEERAIQNESVFAAFPKRIAELAQPFVSAPIVGELWRMLGQHSDGNNLGRRIARGRHLLESSWANDTLELPQSAVCGLAEFHWFLAHVLANLHRFQVAYNEALASYRRAHGLRNRAHPVPDLADDDGWLEAPFWIWSADNPSRQAVFVRQSGRQLVLSDRDRRSFTLSLAADDEAGAAAQQLADLAIRGVKIRTRALTTTLFARLVLSDLFLHGIGGAKYDQVTDQLAEQFFGFALPQFATVSATLRLPIVHGCAQVDRLRELRHELRELDYHPERFLDRDDTASPGTTAIGQFVSDKLRWIRTARSHQNARTRHEAIVAANTALQPFVAPRRTGVHRELDDTARRLHACAILESRDYSFALFPREHLQRLMLGAP